MILLVLGCVNLDAFVHRPVHCSTVSEATCGTDSPWDQVCLSCEEPYDFEKDYPWIEGTLQEGESVRPIDEALVQRLSVDTRDGLAALDLVFLASHGQDPDNARITVLYNHGNYAGIEHYAPRLRFLHEGGFNVLAWDYRGYGKSEPATLPTPQQWIEDAEQIRDYADTLAPDPERIVLYANSLGGIPAIDMALYRPGCALMLEAPFTSMSQIVEGNSGAGMPGTYVSEGEWENVDEIAAYEGPLFSMSGTADTFFTTEGVRELHEAAGGPDVHKAFWELEGVGHGITGGGVPEGLGLATYFEQIDAFLDGPGSACR